MESRNRTLVTETVTVKPELRGVLPTSQILIPKSTYVKRFRVYQIKIIRKEYIYIYILKLLLKNSWSSIQDAIQHFKF